MSRYYSKKRGSSHSRNGKDDANHDESKNQSPGSPLSRQSLSSSATHTYHTGEQSNASRLLTLSSSLYLCKSSSPNSVCAEFLKTCAVFGLIRRVLRDRPREASPQIPNSSQVHTRGKGEPFFFLLVHSTASFDLD